VVAVRWSLDRYVRLSHVRLKCCQFVPKVTLLC
jgi:hypothetical protein